MDLLHDGHTQFREDEGPPFEGPAALTAERVAVSPGLSSAEKAEILNILGIDRDLYERGKNSPYYRKVRKWTTSRLTQEANELDGPTSTTTDDPFRMVS
jgi:hypothetical protein